MSDAGEIILTSIIGTLFFLTVLAFLIVWSETAIKLANIRDVRTTETLREIVEEVLKEREKRKSA